ncbi:hypothetical protein [Chromobacterium paludis]|uniref:Uncharacterized protein n=1 Tax=Chromobacterium paludis TaxID=2605945 RepID=A0A5C1DFC6_9NEIS|nr:hypothetical protein [Chromobacterium paludis]QEL55492.1 hypothetical protein FYK34_07900 [Chromobacterium paludis]
MDQAKLTEANELAYEASRQLNAIIVRRVAIQDAIIRWLAKGEDEICDIVLSNGAGESQLRLTVFGWPIELQFHTVAQKGSACELVLLLDFVYLNLDKPESIYTAWVPSNGRLFDASGSSDFPCDKPISIEKLLKMLMLSVYKSKLMQVDTSSGKSSGFFEIF